MPRAVPLQKRSETRVFIIENSASPAHAPQYKGLARALAPTKALGTLTPIRIPSRDAYEQFDVVTSITGTPGLPTLSLEIDRQRVLSEMLKLANIGCPIDIQVHSGACKNPSDFNQGWEIIDVFEIARMTNISAGDLGALDPGEDGIILETAAFEALEWYQIKPLAPNEIAAADIVAEVIDTVICDSAACGACGIASDGCQKVFALTLANEGSPGLPAALIYSSDGGATIDQTVVSTLAANEAPDAMACVGTYLVVVSEDSASLHYASLVDILAGTETWTEVSTGFVGGGEPRRIFSLGSTFTWIAGAGGYIYFTTDPTGGVTPQTSGGVTVQDLNAIHGVDELNLVAVGNQNAVLVTDNGGASWSAVTGPAPAVALNAVFMKSKLEWLVGSAGGVLYYTIDGGANWTTKAFPGSGAGQIRDIVFATPTDGFMAHDTTSPRGRILRTIDGGYSWYTLPESTGFTFPANDRINALAACTDDPNVVYGGGLADNATDGILVKAA